MATNTIEAELLDLEQQYWQAIKEQDVEEVLRLTDEPCIITGAAKAPPPDAEQTQGPVLLHRAAQRPTRCHGTRRAASLSHVSRFLQIAGERLTTADHRCPTQIFSNPYGYPIVSHQWSVRRGRRHP
jgi:hypothetical protein